MTYPFLVPQRTADTAGVESVPVTLHAGASTARIAVRDALNANQIKAVTTAYTSPGFAPYNLIFAGSAVGPNNYGLIENDGKAFLELTYLVKATTTATPAFSVAPSCIVYGLRTLDREFGPFAAKYNTNFPSPPVGVDDSPAYFQQNQQQQLWLPLMNDDGNGIVQTFSTTRIYKMSVGSDHYGYLDPIYLKTRGFARFLVLPTAGTESGNTIDEAVILGTTTG